MSPDRSHSVQQVVLRHSVQRVLHHLAVEVAVPMVAYHYLLVVVLLGGLDHYRPQHFLAEAAVRYCLPQGSPEERLSAMAVIP